MTILHLALFTWREAVTHEDIDALTSELRQMAAGIPELISYECGPALQLRPGGADYGVAATVARPEDLAAYLDSDAHQHIYQTRLGAMIHTRQSVQLAMSVREP
jgi:hypothetical protein